MAEIFKRLGSEYPADTTETTVYEVPTGKMAIISVITLCNISAGADTVSLGITDGGVLAEADYIYHDKSMAADATDSTLGRFTLEEGYKVIVVMGAGGSINCNVFGTEIDVS
jgi:hypothetical protein